MKSGLRFQEGQSRKLIYFSLLLVPQKYKVVPKLSVYENSPKNVHWGLNSPSGVHFPFAKCWLLGPYRRSRAEPIRLHDLTQNFFSYSLIYC